MVYKSAPHEPGPTGLHCIEAIFRELRRECARLRQCSMSSPARYAAARDGQRGREFLLLEKSSWKPLATFTLQESWRSPAPGPAIETEFDVQGLLGSRQRYVYLTGFGRVPQPGPGISQELLLQAALRKIRQLHEPAGLAGVAGHFSLQLGGRDKYVQSLLHNLRAAGHCTGEAPARVALREENPETTEDVMLPDTLRAWLRQGARVGRDAYWDAEQGQARLLLWLALEHRKPALEEQKIHSWPVPCCPATGVAAGL